MWLIGEGRAIRFMILKDIRALLINGVVALWDFKMERTYANLTVRATKKKESRKKKHEREGYSSFLMNIYVIIPHMGDRNARCAVILRRVNSSRSIPSVSGVQQSTEIHPSDTPSREQGL